MGLKIYRGEPVDGRVAESVKIGDPLTMVISIDHQDIYGMHVSECYVRDGLGWSDQGLINDEGCPVDWEIMGEFEYSSSKTTALVHFQAHKFPYTSSVYYQCNVRLCIRHAGGCEDTPPICDAQGQNLLKKRRKRQTLELDETQGLLYDTDRNDLKVKVYRGLYVSEANDLDDAFIDEDVSRTEVRTYDPNTICFPQRDFAIGIAVAGVVLILSSLPFYASYPNVEDVKICLRPDLPYIVVHIPILPILIAAKTFFRDFFVFHVKKNECFD